MKKFFSFVLVSVLCVSLFAIPSSATTTYNDFYEDLTVTLVEVWFADVVYQDEIVGFGYFHYTAGGGWWIFGHDAEIETEYQNYGLPRTLGVNNGINVTVYARGQGASGTYSDIYSWSDNDYRGGNTLGWISAIAELDDKTATYLNGYVKIVTPAGTDTLNYRVYGQ